AAGTSHPPVMSTPRSLVLALLLLPPALDGSSRSTERRSLRESRTVTSIEHWRAGSPFVLRGSVTVAPGGTLSIDPGTRMEATPGSAIVIQRGGRIIADGTMLRPIVLSCRSSVKLAGCWEGLVINGNAPINIGTPVPAAGQRPRTNAIVVPPT